MLFKALVPAAMPVNELQALQQLRNHALYAVDGKIGVTEELYFDDVTWKIRYLVVDATSWLPGRWVLISPVTVGEVRPQERAIDIELTRGQIRDSPPLSSAAALSREYEERYYRYYGWPPYWELTPLFDLLSDEGRSPQAEPRHDERAAPPERTHLLSSAQVAGSAVAAYDGDVGRISDFVIDTRYWALRYLEVNLGSRWAGRHVLLSPRWIDTVDRYRQSVRSDLTREAIRTAPPYEPGKPLDRNYEVRLFRHYGRTTYW